MIRGNAFTIETIWFLILSSLITIVPKVSSFVPTHPRRTLIGESNIDKKSLQRNKNYNPVVFFSSRYENEQQEENESDKEKANAVSTKVSSSRKSSSVAKFLGRGKDAIVRPGVVLVAPPDEYHHFLREAAVFIYAMGEDDHGVYVIRGVIIDHPTPFNIQEMMVTDDKSDDATTTSSRSDGDSETPSYLQNFLFRGGDLGDAAFMFHSDMELASRTQNEMIGTSGIYQGDLEYAMSNNYSLDPSKAKFFFSYMEFTEDEIEEMLANRENESTQWLSVEVPPDIVLNSDWGRGEAWARLRNAVRGL